MKQKILNCPNWHYNQRLIEKCRYMVLMGLCVSRPLAFCLTMALTLAPWVTAPNLYLPALAPNLDLPLNLYLPALASKLCLLGLAPYLCLPALASNLCLPALVPNLHLEALAPSSCLPTLTETLHLPPWSLNCIYQLWPRLCPPICISQSRSRFYYYYHSC